MDLARLRQEYAASGLDVEDLAADPVEQFLHWLNAAALGGVREPNAMIVATAAADGRPSSRIVLLKGVDGRGFTFFTNYASRKARDIEANPRVSLTFPWIDLGRQVQVQGEATQTSDAESDAYFASRPRGAQLGAWASQQSRPLDSRKTLEAALAEVATRFDGSEVPRPPGWGGFRVSPVEVEFWQGRPNRLHDRLVYRREGTVWRIERRYP